MVRHITPTDKQLLADGLRRLSPETVRRRFLAPKPRLTAGDLRYLTEVDGERHVALVALDARDPERLLAVGRFVRLREDPETAEVAIVVCDELQGRGLGKRLAILLADEARALGVRRFGATILADNVPALRLMRTLVTRLASGGSQGEVRELVADIAA